MNIYLAIYLAGLVLALYTVAGMPPNGLKGLRWGGWLCVVFWPVVLLAAILHVVTKSVSSL